MILYADKMTGSLDYAIGETNRRREKQKAHNKKHGITPESIRKEITDVLRSVAEQDYVTVDIGESGEGHLVGYNFKTHIAELDKLMQAAAANLEFEEAARIRDEVRRLEAKELGLDRPGMAQKASGTSWKHSTSGKKKAKSRKRFA